MTTQVVKKRRNALRPLDPSQRAQRVRLYLWSSWNAWRGPRLPDVERFCFFVGYARSGHSLIGSLLNAHPEMVISHELDALDFVQKGFHRSQLFSLILTRDEDFGAIGRIWTGYDYTVPHQFQGLFDRLRVIGDKKGGKTAYELSRRPELLDRVRTTVDLPIRVIHVTRNPFDNIVAHASRQGWSISATSEWYERRCRAAEQTTMRLDPDELCIVPYESFARDPQRWLTELCKFLGVDSYESYLRDCAAVVHPSSTQRRHSVTWDETDRRRVEEIIEKYDFLHGYTFDDSGEK